MVLGHYRTSILAGRIRYSLCTGRDPQVESDGSSSHSSEYGDKSTDYIPPGGGKGRRRNEPGGSTTIVSGSVVLIGDWRGCLAISADYSIILGDVIAQGAHGVVHGGTLLQNGAQVSAVAVKKSNITETLVNEFSVYQQLAALPLHSLMFWALYLFWHRIPGHPVCTESPSPSALWTYAEVGPRGGLRCAALYAQTGMDAQRLSRSQSQSPEPSMVY
ncbi:hypothetical protein B0H13DRAFT_1903829 [Mycena leptocephala]|nr:hypothetical protein B0H13DRAFT_1903829 [Mycena leptocephala]